MTSASVYFTVKLDNHDLGGWSSCSGLGWSVDIKDKLEGGNPYYALKVVGRLKWDPITLTRPIGAGTPSMAGWFLDMVTKPKRTNCEIRLMQTDRKAAVAVWNLHGVLPKTYKGPDFNVETNKVATESITFEHHGLLNAVVGPTTPLGAEM